MTTRKEFADWFALVLSEYRNNEIEYTYYNPALDEEYEELIDFLVANGNLQVLTPKNKYYIVGILDAYTINRKRDSKEMCFDYALCTLLEKEYYGMRGRDVER